jgi:hypothetical protein
MPRPGGVLPWASQPPPVGVCCAHRDIGWVLTTGCGISGRRSPWRRGPASPGVAVRLVGAELTAAIWTRAQRCGSPSARNHSFSSGPTPSPGTGSPASPGVAATASTSSALTGSRSTRTSCRCPDAVSVTTSVTKYRRNRTCPGCRRRAPAPGLGRPGVSYTNGWLTPSPTGNGSWLVARDGSVMPAAGTSSAPASRRHWSPWLVSAVGPWSLSARSRGRVGGPGWPSLSVSAGPPLGPPASVEAPAVSVGWSTAGLGFRSAPAAGGLVGWSIAGPATWPASPVPVSPAAVSPSAVTAS